MALVETGIMTDIKLGNTDVQLVLQGGNVIWERIHDYSLDYLTLEVVGSSAGTFNFEPSSGFSQPLDIEFSKNDGPWVHYASASTVDKSVVNGDKIRVKGTNPTYTYIPTGTGSAYFSRMGIGGTDFSIYGNIMSLIHGDSFVGIKILTEIFSFTGLFNSSNCVDVEHLILPATALTSYCYSNLLKNSRITTAPQLPATVLADSCYYEMFYNCTSLVNAPVLNVPTLLYGCYNRMFYGCSSLNYVKCLATDISASSCTEQWLGGVSPTGAFVKSPNMGGWTTGISGIPSGWTVVDAT